MYASFFGLRELPFNNTPDPRFFFSTPDHEEALACLIYAINEGKGFVLLTGEVGAGKTLVTRLMLRHFGERIDFATINHTQVSAGELVQVICSEFGVETAPRGTNAENVRRLQDFLLTRYAADRPVVLMLDEAQSLSREAFEQVRMIGNLEADSAKLLQIVIVGQPELRHRFEADDMRQLRQRIFRSFHLGGLTREQTEGYIRHRLGVAGAAFPDRIFQGGAIDAIHKYSQGLPRIINTLCDNAMLSAFASDNSSIDHAFMTQTIAQMMTLTQASTAAPATAPAAGPAKREVERNAPTVEQFGEQAPPRRRAAEAPLVPDDYATALTQFAQNLRGEFGRLLAADADHVRAQLANAQLEQKATAAARDLQLMLDRASMMQQELGELLEATRNAGTPHLKDARRAARRLKRLIDEAVGTESRVHEAVTGSEAAQRAVEGAATQLSEQSVRAGRLCLTLRNMLEKAEARATAAGRAMTLDQRAVRRLAADAVAPNAGRAPRIVSNDLSDKGLQDRFTRLADTIGEQKGTIENIRELLASCQPTAIANADKRGGGNRLRLTGSVSQLVEAVRGV